MTGDCFAFKFLRRCVDGKHLISFHSETFVFKFLRRSEDRALSLGRFGISDFSLMFFLWEGAGGDGAGGGGGGVCRSF